MIFINTESKLQCMKNHQPEPDQIIEWVEGGFIIFNDEDEHRQWLNQK